MIKEYNGKKVITLYYNTEIKRFYDDFGTIIDDIYRIITPNQALVFLKDKEYRTFEDVTHSFIVELIYPEEETIEMYHDIVREECDRSESEEEIFDEYLDSFYEESEVMHLNFDPKINRFTDEDGKIVNDIYRYAHPGRVLIFRDYKHQYLFPSVDGKFLVELNYPDDPENYEY